MCGQAFEGAIVLNHGGPDTFAGKLLRMHVRECSEREIRIPFHVGEDRSRTWVFTRTAAGLRLKHDHRHADGTEDAVTMYGGDATAAGTAAEQRFPADQQSRDLFLRSDLAPSVTNVWVIGLVPGSRYSYALSRPGREIRIDFDLRKSVEAPPPPW